jgi:HrpA-like RNA helicase
MYLNQKDRRLQITHQGQEAAKIPFDPMWAYAIQVANRECQDVVAHIIGIAALRSAQQPIFLDPPHIGYTPWQIFAYPASDHITELTALYMYEQQRVLIKSDDDLNNWCNHHLLDRRALEAVIGLRNAGLRWGGTHKWDDKLVPSALTNIRRVLARSFFRNTAIATKEESKVIEYRTIHMNNAGQLDMYSNLHATRPKWIVYDKFTLLGAVPTLSFGTAIDPEWIKVCLSRNGMYRTLKLLRTCRTSRTIV